jgi:hypothetical protein
LRKAATSPTIPAMRKIILMLAIAAAASAGCGDDDDTTADAAPMTLAQNCTTYCSEIATTCTGTDAQYPTTAGSMHCAMTCPKFPMGAATDMAMNTLGCRLYHIQNAQRTGDKATHCPHAGPGGAKVDAAAGTCGDACSNFCALEMSTCTGANQKYTDMAACMSACAGFDKTTPYTGGTTPAGNTLACRLYHVTNAAVSADAATTHCPHTASPAAAVCL